MSKNTSEETKRSNKKLKVFLIILGLFVLAAVVILIQSAQRRANLANSLATGETSTSEEAVASEEETPEVTVSYKDEMEMNSEYS